MIHDIPLLRSLDPHHARLGYLGALATVSVRTLDTFDALLARFRDLLYERFYAEEPEFVRAISIADPVALPELLKRAERDPEENPAAILSPPDRSPRWLTRSEAWLYEYCMPSHTGYLLPKHAGRTIDLARWTGVLLPTLDLSESGFLLQHLVGGESSNLGRNLLFVRARPALAMLYVRLLFASDILFPVLINEFADRVRGARPLATRGANGLLRAAVQRLMESVGEPTDPEDILTFMALRQFSEAILKSASTEENYLRPRLEMLVDLGVVVRKGGEGADRPGAFPWTLPEASLELADALRPLAERPQCIDEWLNSELVGTLGPALGLPLRAISGSSEVLLWFSRAFREIGREIGFSPGRTVAQLASLLAAEAGICLEVDTVYSVVYALPSGPWADYFRFSGGSRFDREFMIKVDTAVIDLLEKSASTA